MQVNSQRIFENSPPIGSAFPPPTHPRATPACRKSRRKGALISHFVGSLNKRSTRPWRNLSLMTNPEAQTENNKDELELANEVGCGCSGCGCS